MGHHSDRDQASHESRWRLEGRETRQNDRRSRSDRVLHAQCAHTVMLRGHPQPKNLKRPKRNNWTWEQAGYRLAGRATISVEHVHHRRRRHGWSKSGDRRPQRHARHSRAGAPSGEHKNTGRQGVKRNNKKQNYLHIN